MKTTTTILFISMFFSATTPSILFSAEKDNKIKSKEILELITKEHIFDLTDNSDKRRLDLEIESYELAPEKREVTITTTFGKKICLSPSTDGFKKFVNHQLFLSILDNKIQNCRKLLEANADPNWKTEDDDSTPLQVACGNVLRGEDEETAWKIYQLLKGANESHKNKPDDTE